MQLWQMDIVGGVVPADGTEAKIVTGWMIIPGFCVMAKVVARAVSGSSTSVPITDLSPVLRPTGRTTHWRKRGRGRSIRDVTQLGADDAEGYFAGLDRLAERLLASSGAEYEIGLETLGYLMTHLTTQQAAGSLYMIWGYLTDQIDLPPGRASEPEASAISKMHRAASEWLAIERTPAAILEYLDRWVYKECGYERRT